MEFKKKDIFLIPNILTYLRFLCVPFFIWSSIDKKTFGYHYMMIAFAIFLLASITDVIDGKIARRFNMISDIGKVLDPFADKLLQVSAVICLALPMNNNLHFVFPIILGLKELYMIIAASAIVKRAKNINVQANIYGKVAAVFNAVGIILSFFHNMTDTHLYYIDWAFMSLGCMLAILAAFVYTIQIGKQLRLNKEKSE